MPVVYRNGTGTELQAGSTPGPFHDARPTAIGRYKCNVYSDWSTTQA